MQRITHHTQSFDGFTIDLTRGCLLRGNEEIKLPPKPFKTLKYLVGNPGRLISKAELMQVIWPDVAVTDDSLVQCMREVRLALGDDAQQIIKTVPKRGYIFDREVRDTSPGQLTTYTEETAGVQLIIEERETNESGAIAAPVAESVGLIPAPGARAIDRLMTAIRPLGWRAVAGVLILVIAASAIVYFTRPGEVIDSVAVMPFVNVSGDTKHGIPLRRDQR